MISQRIEQYKQRIEASLGYSLADIRNQKETLKYPAEKRQALCLLECEVQSVINQQALIMWLESEQIPEIEWDDYAYFDGKLLRNGQEVELDGV